MKCPHCDYTHNEWNHSQEEYANRRVGPFYEFPLKLKTPETQQYFPKEAYLYGCPSCKKTFID